MKMKDLIKERQALVDHVIMLEGLLLTYPNLIQEYKEHLTNEIAFCIPKLKEMNELYDELTSVKEVDTRASRRANKNK